jgi:hypothetical protein
MFSGEPYAFEICCICLLSYKLYDYDGDDHADGGGHLLLMQFTFVDQELSGPSLHGTLELSLVPSGSWSMMGRIISLS